MKYYVLYLDEDKRIHKKGANSLVQAVYLKRRIRLGKIRDKVIEIVADLKSNLNIEVKTEKEILEIMQNVENDFEDGIRIVSENEWNEWIKGKTIIPSNNRNVISVKTEFDEIICDYYFKEKTVAKDE